MGSKKIESSKKGVNRGAWTAEEDRNIAQVIAIHGAKRWKTIAAKAGLNRCGKSCRLRWLNYLRPNIKRGNISDEEEDLILRLHKLLGNRWSLIAGRLPGRTDNEIKNYWNSHLSKKINQSEKQRGDAGKCSKNDEEKPVVLEKVNKVEIMTRSEGNTSTERTATGNQLNKMEFNLDDFFDFSNEGPLNLEWMSKFLESDEGFSNDL